MHVTTSFVHVIGLIAKIVDRVKAIDSTVMINVLIRPREGNFIYSEDEFEIILHDIDAAKRAGAHGIFTS